jgi:hypothetical protein
MGFVESSTGTSDGEDLLGDKVSSSYVGYGGSEITPVQVRVARYCRKRWLKSEVISNIIDMGATIRIICYPSIVHMYLVERIPSNNVNYIVEELTYLVSGSLQDWFSKSLASFRGYYSGIGVVVIDVRRCFFNYATKGSVAGR